MNEFKVTTDGQLDVAIGTSATSKTWRNTKIMWSELVARLAKPVVTVETYKEYNAMPKSDRAKVKDLGGYVGGFLVGGKRDKASVSYRQIITLDVDFSHDNFWWDFTMLYDCAAVLHATHSSGPNHVRHRLIIPLDRQVSCEEYQAIARKIAGNTGINCYDSTTFDVNRLMFWPSIPKDVEYDFHFQDGAFLSADKVLATYSDWRNVMEWPSPEDEAEYITKTINKQENPVEKSGIVGTFCRAYSVTAAIETFLSDVYVKSGKDRYTYTQGSTASGLVVYKDLFAYSHHSTDPAGNRLCNAFDLVRIHKFGNLDKKPEDTASFKAMEVFATKDPEIRKRIATENIQAAKFDFAEPYEDPTPEDTEWLKSLTVNTKGEYETTANNINIILSNDPKLKGAFKLNTFNNKRYVVKSLPWRTVKGEEPLKDVDYAGLHNYIECLYNIGSFAKIDDAFALDFEKNQYHPIQEYLKGLSWDGSPRVDTLLIDYFGAEDTPYTRAIIRKTLAAAVARVFQPGIKFDTALVIVGPQGSYKSTFVKKLGRDWFSDTFTTVQGKEAFEQIQGAWIVEMAELSGLKKAEVEAIKHYISKREDSFRPAYGRVVETYKRQCVFFGTTNSQDFLHDPSGNRRFLPVDVNTARITKSVIEDMTDEEVDQIWAEAYQIYKNHEPLYLQEEAAKLAVDAQNKHEEADNRRGIIINYLDRLYPEDWDSKDVFERKQWLEDPLSANGTVRKDYVCIAEIWCECLGKDRADMTRYNTRDLNEIMRTIDHWENTGSTKTFVNYGVQKYYRRKEG